MFKSIDKTESFVCWLQQHQLQCDIVTHFSWHCDKSEFEFFSSNFFSEIFVFQCHRHVFQAIVFIECFFLIYQILQMHFEDHCHNVTWHCDIFVTLWHIWIMYFFLIFKCGIFVRYCILHLVRNKCFFQL